MRRLVLALVVFAVVASACTSSDTDDTTTTATPEPEVTTTSTAPPAPEALNPDDLFVNLVWHQHQPLYPKDEDGVVTRPWVRVHATKDYYDMAAMAGEYEGLNITFNLTPVLLLQLEDIVDGAKDSYWVHTEIPAEELTDDQKAFIMARFWDINPKIIDRFPRYRELRDSEMTGWPSPSRTGAISRCSGTSDGLTRGSLPRSHLQPSSSRGGTSRSRTRSSCSTSTTRSLRTSWMCTPNSGTRERSR
jgi:hypothetical protein